MNEELQSTNEELHTINEELKQRTDELNQTNSFLQLILGSLHTGIVGLDSKLNVVSWNRRSEDLWELRLEEVQGQSFMNLDIGLPVDQLKVSIRGCLAGEADYEDVVVDAINRRGKAIKCRVACTPISAKNQERRGVILMMEEQEMA